MRSLTMATASATLKPSEIYMAYLNKVANYGLHDELTFQLKDRFYSVYFLRRKGEESRPVDIFHCQKRILLFAVMPIEPVFPARNSEAERLDLKLVTQCINDVRLESFLQQAHEHHKRLPKDMYGFSIEKQELFTTNMLEILSGNKKECPEEKSLQTLHSVQLYRQQSLDSQAKNHLPESNLQTYTDQKNKERVRQFLRLKSAPAGT